jgi:hypothetical protein
MKKTKTMSMTIYIHVSKEMKKKLFLRSKVSHMEIDCKEQKAPKMTKH